MSDKLFFSHESIKKHLIIYFLLILFYWYRYTFLTLSLEYNFFYVVLVPRILVSYPRLFSCLVKLYLLFIYAPCVNLYWYIHKKKTKNQVFGNFTNIYFPDKYRKLEVQLLENVMHLSERQSIILHSIKVHQWFYHLTSQWFIWKSRFF